MRSTLLQCRRHLLDDSSPSHRAKPLFADEQGRLLKYILRPPLATERLLPGPDELARIALKKPFSDGTVAVDLDPLSLSAASSLSSQMVSP